jgi:hypothetical protein
MKEFKALKTAKVGRKNSAQLFLENNQIVEKY